MSHLAELLPVAVGDEGLEGLEAGVDALHAPALVAVGDLPPDAPLLVTRRLRGQRDVRQTTESRDAQNQLQPNTGSLTQEARHRLPVSTECILL